MSACRIEMKRTDEKQIDILPFYCSVVVTKRRLDKGRCRFWQGEMNWQRTVRKATIASSHFSHNFDPHQCSPSATFNFNLDETEGTTRTIIIYCICLAGLVMCLEAMRSRISEREIRSRRYSCRSSTYKNNYDKFSFLHFSHSTVIKRNL